MKNRTLGILSLLIGGYLIFTSGRSIFTLLKAGSRITTVQNDLTETKKQNELLRKKLQEVKSPAYVEKIARSELNMAKPGESVVILPPNLESATPKKPSPEAKISHWQKWYQLFF